MASHRNSQSKKSLGIKIEASTALKAKKETRGYMALRNNVFDLKLELWNVLKPLEMQLLDIIIDKTIKWRQKVAQITIQEWVERTRQADTHIYAALRNLKRMKVIHWRKERSFSSYGLNEDFFGGLLIKKHEDELQARKNKIKVVVDNSKTTDEIRHTNRRNTSEEVANFVSPTDEIRQTKPPQDHEIIQENGSLNTFLKDIFIKTSLKDSQKRGELHSLLGAIKPGNASKREQLKDPQAEAERQLREARRAGILN